MSIFVSTSFCSEFIDNFEYSDSPINHGWMFKFGGSDSNIFTSKESFSINSRSLKGYVKSQKYERIGLKYNFRNNEFGKIIRENELLKFSVMFYDVYEKENNSSKEDRRSKYDIDGNVKESLRKIYRNKNDDSARFTISFYFFATETYDKYITISWSGDNYQYWTGRNWKYIKPRKKGWHKVLFKIVRNKVSLLFDNSMIAENLHYVLKPKCLSWCSNGIAPNVEAYSWIDDIKFSRK